jgi:hypothetical protein
MARYGVDYYGLVAYGSDTTSFIEFDASPFTATPIGYQKIRLEWTSPSGDWSRIRLVRNTYGFPLSVDDGAVVYDEPKSFDSGVYDDSGEIPDEIGLKPGIAYHYSLFVFDTQNEVWVKAGNAFGISIKDYGTFDYIYNALPGIYRTNNLKVITDTGNNEDLEDFLRIFAVALDLYKTNADLVRQTYDTSVAYAPIIPVMMQQFGLAFEPELGLQQSRILLRNVAYIDKSKGSLEGIENFIKAFTGYDQITTPSKNIMLDYNDSSFEESVGRWASIAHCTLARVNNATVTPYSEPSLPSLFPNKAAGALQVNTTNGGDAELACGLSNPKTRGIPVKEGFVYTFSIYTQASASNKRRNVHVDIRWFNLFGQEISRAGEVSILDPFGSWGRVAVTDTAPVNCFFAIPTIRIEGSSNNEHHWFDAAQFEESSLGATEFEEARGINITLKATRVNELENPGFETTLTPWVTTGATATRSNTIKDTDRNSAFSLSLVSTSDNIVEVLYDRFMPVSEGFWYSASGYVRTGFTGARAEDRLGNWAISWYDPNQTLISTSTGSAQNLTEFYNVTEYYRTQGILTVYTTETTNLIVGQDVRLLEFDDPSLDGEYEVQFVSGRYFQVAVPGPDILLTEVNPGTFVQNLNTSFVRNSFSALSPSNAAYAKVKFIWDNPLTGQTIHLDSCMFESSTIAKPYFDGSTGFSSTSDLVWEGSPYESRSHYYKNRVATQLRLISQLPSYLINGTPFVIKLAQPLE